MSWFTKKEKTQPHEAKLPDGTDAKLEEFSPTWKFIERHLQEELNAARKKNDSMHHDPIATAYIRGEINRLKKLQDLPNAGRDNRPGILTRQDAEGNNE